MEYPARRYLPKFYYGFELNELSQFILNACFFAPVLLRIFFIAAALRCCVHWSYGSNVTRVTTLYNAVPYYATQFTHARTSNMWNQTNRFEPHSFPRLVRSHGAKPKHQSYTLYTHHPHTHIYMWLCFCLCLCCSFGWYLSFLNNQRTTFTPSRRIK